MQTKLQCTYCEEPNATSDHVIARALWVGQSRDRSIKVPSCEKCNGLASEGLLKSFLSAFDNRLAQERIKELIHPKGRGELREFVDICSPDLRVVFADDTITKTFKKMFLGLRRHTLRKQWTFLSPFSISVFIIEKAAPNYIVRLLPLMTEGENRGFLLSPQFHDEIELKSFSQKFRDFHFDISSLGVMKIRYAKNNERNELILVAIDETMEAQVVNY